jgi:hypothetical protein
MARKKSAATTEASATMTPAKQRQAKGWGIASLKRRATTIAKRLEAIESERLRQIAEKSRIGKALNLLSEVEKELAGDLLPPEPVPVAESTVDDDAA